MCKTEITQEWLTMLGFKKVITINDCCFFILPRIRPLVTTFIGNVDSDLWIIDLNGSSICFVEDLIELMAELESDDIPTDS